MKDPLQIAARRAGILWALIVGGATFGFVLSQGWWRIRINPEDVIGVGLLFAALTGILAYRIARRRRLRRG